MQGRSTVDSWLETGALLHPLSGTPSFVDLIRLLAGYSGGPKFDDTAGMKELRNHVNPADHIVFVLVDGLGMRFRHLFPEGGFLSQTFRTELRAIFPSTTAAALTTLASGAWPAEHGITGWWTYFAEEDRTVCPLTFRERVSDTPAGQLGLRMDSLLPVRSLYPAYFRETRSYLPAYITGGEYSTWASGGTPVIPYRSTAQLTRRLSRAIRRSRRATFSYVYTTEVDSTSHKTGTSSDEVAEAVRNNDHLLGMLRDALPDSARIVVTADHGLIDVPEGYTLELGDDHPLLRHLVAPPNGETSVPLFHVREGHEHGFAEAFAEAGLQDKYALLTAEEAMDMRLYGRRQLSPTMSRHVGTFIGIALEPWVLEYVPTGKSRVGLRAVHGGLRPEEMRTALFAI